MSFGISAGTALLAGATVGSALLGSNAASSAADAQAQSASESNALQKQMFDLQRADNAPFLQNGTAASNNLAQLLGIGSSAPALLGNSGGAPTYNAELYASNPAYKQAYDDLAAQHYAAYGTNYTSGSDRGWIEQGIQSRLGADGMAGLTPKNDSSFGSLLKPITRADIEADPTYAMGLQFGLSEGEKGINRQAAAGGNFLSGATLKALTKYGTDYAGTKAGDAVNRIGAQRQQTYSMLGGVSGAGQAASGQSGAAAQNYGTTVGNTTTSLGNARGASGIAGANAFTGALNSGIGAYQGNQLLQALQKKSGVASSDGWGTPTYDPVYGGG